jgi:magnesium transporter
LSHAPEDQSVERLRDLLETDDDAALRAFLDEVPHASDVAELLEELDEEDRVHVVRALDPATAAEALAEMDPEEHPEDSLAALEPAQMAAVVAEMSDDDAADLIGEMAPEDQRRVLAALPLEEAGEIRDLMRYPEDSAGGIMTTELVAIPVGLTAAEATEEVRRQAQEQEIEELYVVFVVDHRRVLQGFLPLARLVSASPAARVAELVEEVPATVLPETDRVEVARAVSRYNLTVVAVVDGAGRLLGGVTFDDVLDVMEEENTRDILGLGGTSQGEELRGGWGEAVRSRLPWLFVNLITAFAAASVVYAFEDVVGKVALLAVCMPVIAGMGGNTGTQALAVTVRRLALTAGSKRPWGVLLKELLVGATNGLATGLVAAAAAYGLSIATHGNPRLALVVLLAMWLNLSIGGFAGAFVPTVLERFGNDPAVASSIFVTTFTDTFGFFLLLGLASQMLL